ncbi:unnamed protein product [Pieris brassicae]|uniref:Uncharacterized protein n=1 Tax=Pieris brassicae TaxID=7116 RepID=A0A9P0TCW0_PIEBR|nr:unnamed protein product [Pieris brassicae]
MPVPKSKYITRSALSPLLGWHNGCRLWLAWILGGVWGALVAGVGVRGLRGGAWVGPLGDAASGAARSLPPRSRRCEHVMSAGPASSATHAHARARCASRAQTRASYVTRSLSCYVFVPL